MYLQFIDNKFVSKRDLENGVINLKYVQIEDNLLERLSTNFLHCFKVLLKREKNNSIKIYKKKPKNTNKDISFECFVNKTNYKLINVLGFNYIEDYEKDLLIIKKYYKNKLRKVS